jgi:phospholipase A1
MKIRIAIFLSITITSFSIPVYGQGYKTINDCLQSEVLTSPKETSIGDLTQQCQTKLEDKKGAQHEDLVEQRMAKDEENVLSPFTLMAHRPNYALIGAYNSEGYDASIRNEVFNDDIAYNDYESQFQLSIKFPLMVNIFGGRADLYAAYTNKSFWQVYNDASAPFRETNHEPEAWVQFNPKWEFLGFKNTWNSIGINHQSNGQGGELSRSWNRIFGWFTVERDDLALSFRPWYRIPESDDQDNNPDITDYLGHFELTGSYKYSDHVFSLMSRNNLESGFERGAIEASWSFPLGSYPYLKGYARWFNGYGESLIDYDRRSNTIGLGISLVDWL